MKLPDPLKNENGFVLVLVIIIGVLTLFIFANILPQLHMGQQVLALTRLNEYRAYWAAKNGIETVRLGMKNAEPGDFQDLIDPNNGILKAIEDLLGTTAVPKHIEYTYWDEGTASSSTHFVSNCSHIDESILPDLRHEKGKIDIAIIILRDEGAGAPIIPGNVDGERQFPTADAEEDDLIYFYDPVTPQWISVDNPSGTMWNNFQYHNNGVWYCDFDLGITSGNYEQTADFKFEYDGTDWYFSIGNDGSFRKRDSDGTTQLWDKKIDSAGIANPFQEGNDNNDGDGCTLVDSGCGFDDDNDKVEIFIIVRSTGITVAPGSTYDSGPDPTDLMLVNDANSNLPNPIRQVFEVGFLLKDNGSNLLITEPFYFAKVTNLKEDDVP